MNHKLNDTNKGVIIAMIILIMLALVCHISNWIWGRERFNDDNSNQCGGNIKKPTLPAGFSPPQNTRYVNINYTPYSDKTSQCCGNPPTKILDTTPCATGTVLDEATQMLLYKTMYDRAGLEIINRAL